MVQLELFFSVHPSFPIWANLVSARCEYTERHIWYHWPSVANIGHQCNLSNPFHTNSKLLHKWCHWGVVFNHSNYWFADWWHRKLTKMYKMFTLCSTCGDYVTNRGSKCQVAESLPVWLQLYHILPKQALSQFSWILSVPANVLIKKLKKKSASTRTSILQVLSWKIQWI